MLNWWGVLAPAATPAAIIHKYNTALVAMLREPDVQEALAREGIDRAGGSAAEFGAYLRTELDKWSKVAHETGVKLD